MKVSGRKGKGEKEGGSLGKKGERGDGRKQSGEERGKMGRKEAVRGRKGKEEKERGSPGKKGERGEGRRQRKGRRRRGFQGRKVKGGEGRRQRRKRRSMRFQGKKGKDRNDAKGFVKTKEEFLRRKRKREIGKEAEDATKRGRVSGREKGKGGRKEAEVGQRRRR